jgi:hypothetical protein
MVFVTKAVGLERHKPGTIKFNDHVARALRWRQRVAGRSGASVLRGDYSSDPQGRGEAMFYRWNEIEHKEGIRLAQID